MFQPKRILVPMDFSDEALLALDWALMLTKTTSGVTIYPTYVFSILPDAAALDVGRTGYKETTRDWVDQNMANLQKKLPDDVGWNPLYVEGNPAENIVDLCQFKGIDLIVMTTHGRQGISHLLHHSIAEGIVRLAPCPCWCCI